MHRRTNIISPKEYPTRAKVVVLGASACESARILLNSKSSVHPNGLANGSGMGYGVRFFNRMGNLTATGFFTPEMGIEDLSYEGNITNFWDGVPEEVLEKRGLSYPQKNTVRVSDTGRSKYSC